MEEIHDYCNIVHCSRKLMHLSDFPSTDIILFLKFICTVYIYTGFDHSTKLDHFQGHFKDL